MLIYNGGIAVWTKIATIIFFIKNDKLLYDDELKSNSLYFVIVIATLYHKYLEELEVHFNQCLSACSCYAHAWCE